MTVRDGKVVYDLNGMTGERWDTLSDADDGAGSAVGKFRAAALAGQARQTQSRSS